MPLSSHYVLEKDPNGFPKRAQKGRFEADWSRVPDSEDGFGPFWRFLGKSVGYRKPDYLAVFAIGQFRPSK